MAVSAPCEVMVETHDARSGRVKRPEDEALTAPVFTDRFPRTNPATGPIRIEGAAPGDALLSIAGDLKVNQLCLTGIGSSARMEFPKANAGFRKEVLF